MTSECDIVDTNWGGDRYSVLVVWLEPAHWSSQSSLLYVGVGSWDWVTSSILQQTGNTDCRQYLQTTGNITINQPCYILHTTVSSGLVATIVSKHWSNITLLRLVSSLVSRSGDQRGVRCPPPVPQPTVSFSTGHFTHRGGLWLRLDKNCWRGEKMAANTTKIAC